MFSVMCFVKSVFCCVLFCEMFLSFGNCRVFCNVVFWTSGPQYYRASGLSFRWDIKNKQKNPLTIHAVVYNVYNAFGSTQKWWWIPWMDGCGLGQVQPAFGKIFTHTVLLLLSLWSGLNWTFLSLNGFSPFEESRV